MERRGATAIIFDNMGKHYFLILHRNTSWRGWEFPKGFANDGETTEQALIRKVREETGLNKFKVVKKLDIQKKFPHREHFRIDDVFLVESSMNVPIHLSKEQHDTYLWTDKDSVIEKLHWKNDKEIFKVALTELGLDKNV
jgi:8-oxo-dGTP pyrophosphatase MutT (NUDIX family)